MKLFLLGALAMYLLSCAVACALEFTDLVDIWTFGEIYFELPVLILAFPVALVERLPKAIHDAKVLKKFGCNPFGKYCQFDDVDTEILKRISKGVHSSGIRLYCNRIIYKRELKDDQEGNVE